MPFALGAAYVATGEIPDWTTEEGKTALGGYAFVLINFARLIVPARIALALAFAPWVDENIVKRFNPPDLSELPEACRLGGGGVCLIYFTRKIFTSKSSAASRRLSAARAVGRVVLDRQRRWAFKVRGFRIAEVRRHDDASDLVLLGTLEALFESGHHRPGAEPQDLLSAAQGIGAGEAFRRVELHAVQV